MEKGRRRERGRKRGGGWFGYSAHEEKRRERIERALVTCTYSKQARAMHFGTAKKKGKIKRGQLEHVQEAV